MENAEKPNGGESALSQSKGTREFVWLLLAGIFEICMKKFLTIAAERIKRNFIVARTTN